MDVLIGGAGWNTNYFHSASSSETLSSRRVSLICSKTSLRETLSLELISRSKRICRVPAGAMLKADESSQIS